MSDGASERLARMREMTRRLYLDNRRLTIAQLRHFERPLTWEEILALDPSLTASWWRDALMDSDQYGRGLLRWVKSHKGWMLTERGRSLVGV